MGNTCTFMPFHEGVHCLFMGFVFVFFQFPAALLQNWFNYVQVVCVDPLGFHVHAGFEEDEVHSVLSYLSPIQVAVWVSKKYNRSGRSGKKSPTLK